MVNSRSIPEDLWERARKALTFYFSRRHGSSNAEDLAHDTLAVIWKRSDFSFESPEQFLRVVYGFAGRISKHAYRQEQKLRGKELDPSMSARQPAVAGLTGAEVFVFLQDICREGEAGLSNEDWALVQKLMESDISEFYESFGLRDSNRIRVRLHRIRKKLRRFAGLPSPKEVSAREDPAKRDPQRRDATGKKPLEEE